VTTDDSSQNYQHFRSSDEKREKTFKYTRKECNEMGYFRLHLNQYNFVQTIVCLTKNV